MINKVSRNKMRLIRHKRVRENLSGTNERPRLNVFRSNSNITAQIIDDEKGITLVSASTLEKELKINNGGNIEAAKTVKIEKKVRLSRKLLQREEKNTMPYFPLVWVLTCHF